MSPRLRRICALVMTLLVVVVTVAAGLILHLVMTRPYAGFGVFPRNEIRLVDRNSPAHRAGLRVGMVVTQIDGKPVRTVIDIAGRISDAKSGDTIVLAVRDGKSAPRRVAVRLQQPPVPQYLLFVVLAYLIFTSIGLLVFFKSPDDVAVVMYVLCTLAGFVAMVGGFTFRETLAYPGVNVMRIWGTVLIHPFILHFMLRFPAKHRLVERFPQVEFLLYVPAVIFAGVQTVKVSRLVGARGASAEAVNQALAEIPWISNKTIVLATAYLFVSFLLLSHRFYRGNEAIRRRLRPVLVGGALSLLPVVLLFYDGSQNTATFLLGGLNPPITMAFAFLLMIPTGLSLARFRLGDVNAILIKGLHYVSVFLILITLYLFIESVFDWIADWFAVADWFGTTRWEVSRYLSIFTVAVLFKPVHDALQALTARALTPGLHHYRTTLREISRTLTSILDLDQLSLRLVESLRNALSANRVGIFFVEYLEDNSRRVTALASGGYADGQPGNLTWKIPFLIDELEKGAPLQRAVVSKWNPSRPYLAQLDLVQADLLIPLMREEQLTGFVSLGEHEGGEFTAEDIDLLLTLANQAAVAIDNAFTYRKIAQLNQELQQTVDKIESQQKQILTLQEKLINENVNLRQVIAKEPMITDIIGSSAPLNDVLTMVHKVADADSAVLIIGESGTGKELFAHDIHRNSHRRDKAYIKVNCAALTETLLESELFGHEKGSFTGATARRLGRFELAHGGTLFLDEIGEVSLNTQVKLLRVLQEKEFERVGGTKSVKVDVRIITATNRDLERAVKSGTFREDLYYRLNVIRIEVPPLRARRADILELAIHFLERFNKKTGKRIKYIDNAALEYLTAYHWPGNVRELENLVERAVVLSDSDLLTIADFPPEIRASGRGQQENTGNNHEHNAPQKLPAMLEDVERETLLRALHETDGNKSEAARLLGLARSTFFNKLKRFGLA